MTLSSANPVQAPARRKRGEGKERILEAALELFASAGYDATSTPEIARAAKVSQSVVMYHFPTKDILWRETMRRLFRSIEVNPLTDHAAFAGLPLRERFTILLRQFIRMSALRPALGRILFREGLAGGARLSWLMDELAMPQYQSFVSIIEAMKREGGIRDFDPVLLMLAIHGAGATLFNLAPLSRIVTGNDPFEPEVVERQTEMFVSLVMNGILDRQT
jgi:TetR/AcrR family transcriptional regulator